MNNPIKIGDSVRLKSGGPLMTVIRSNEHLFEVWCAYFQSSKDNLSIFSEVLVHIHALKKVGEDE